jgi:hypothetical protein
MAVNTKYYDEYGNPFELMRDENGFWQSAPSPDPIHYEATFTNFGSLDTGLTVQMQGDIGDWFQIDNVRLYGNEDIDDNYNMSIREYNDAELSGNPQLYTEISEFPNPLSEILVPVNEFITHTSFNTILTKMQENYEFLIDKAKFLSVPPNAVSFRYGPNTYDDYDGRNVWTQADNGFSQFWGYTPELNVEHVAGITNAMIYAEGITLYAISTISGADPLPPEVTTPPTRDFYVYGDDKFTDIKSIETDSNEFIWVLDDAGTHGKVGIFEFDENWSLQSSWDVTIKGNQKYMQNPTDLKIKDGKVYISCDSSTGSTEIRVFSEVGSYLGSISHDDLTNIESIAVTTEYVIALSENKLYRFDIDFNFIEVVDLFEKIFTYNYQTQEYDESTITRLCNNLTGVFFYGIAGNQIYKFGQSGDILESFGETMVNYINSTIGDVGTGYYPEKDVTDVYHDNEFNLYASSVYDVVRYYDRAEVYDRLLDDESFNIYDGVWDSEELNVNSDENTTAWVYNRVFDRILDNLNMYRLALKGSQALITTNTFEHAVISNFKPSDFIPLNYVKGDIAVGINELHCEGALNRCIRQLHECFETCLGFINIKDSGIDPDSLTIFSFVLKTQTQPLPIADFIGDTYYFDYGREVSNIDLEWSDSITYRGDPKLRGYITTPLSGEIALPRFPTPTSFIDPSSFSGGDQTWTIRETYDILEKTADVNLKWSARLYAGTTPTNTPDGSDIVDNAIWSSLEPTLDGELPPIDVSSGDRWFVAVPVTEWDAGDIKLYHPDYPEMEYSFDGVNEYTLVNPDLGYGNIGINYYVFMPEDPIYSAGITEINFRLVRT